MFWNKKNNIVKENHHTIIGESARIEGNIKAKNIIRIDGEIKGDIECETRVVIGGTGKVFGNIKAKSLDIKGVFDGKANILESVTIAKTAKVLGEINTEFISIEQGAIFNAKSTTKNVKEIPLPIKSKEVKAQ